MTAARENIPASCPRCGATNCEQTPFNFCSRCAASVSLREEEAIPPMEEELACVLPSTLTHSGLRPRFGDYELLDEIARGGMGVVYRARQVALNRIVAVKMLLFGGLADPDRRRRFQTEAAATAALEHPHIVRILDVGTQDGQPFIAMDFIAGTNLAQAVRERPLAARQAAGYAAKIARAIDFAHQRGVLHRDLKPSNVLLDVFNEPRVTDFGLARNLADDGDLTTTGQMLGSPSFMPPEQAIGDVRRIGRSSDVYGLGAILYHLLTARPPFLEESFQATLAAVGQREPIPLRQLNEKVPRDLETICLKCLEKAPSRRYQTALDLADELDRFLKDEPIRARPVSRFEYGWRWCCRKPALATAYFFLLLLLAVILIGSPLAALRINHERERAEAIADRARRSAYASDMLLACEALENRNRGRVRGLLEKHNWTNAALGLLQPASDVPDDLRDWEWRYLWNQSQSDELSTLVTYANAPWVASWAPSGKDVVTAVAHPSVANSSVMQRWNVSDQRATETFERPGRVRQFQFLPNGELLVVGERDQRIDVHNVLTGRSRSFATGEDSLFAVSLSADGKILGAGGQTWVRLWNVETEHEIARLDPGGDMAASERAIALSNDGKRFAYYKSTGPTDDRSISIVLWDVEKSELLEEFKGHNDRIYQLDFSADKRFLASGSHDKTARLWDLQTQRPRFVFSGHAAPISALAFSPDGQTLATGSFDQTIRLWDTGTGKEIAAWQGHTDWVTSVAFSPSGERIASTSRDGTVRLWKTQRPARESSFKSNSPFVAATRFSPAGDGFWTFDGTDVVTLWNPTNLTATTRFHTSEDTRERVATSPGGQFMAFQVADNNVRIYSTNPFRPVVELSGDTNNVRRLAFSRNGQILAVARDNAPRGTTRTIVLWEWDQAKQLASLNVRQGIVADISFSSDDELLAVGYRDGVVEVWRRQDGKNIASFQGQKDSAAPVLILADNSRVACASEKSGLIRIWDLQKQTEINTLHGELTTSINLAESTDGRRLAVGDGDGAIKIWDLESYTEVAILRGHQEPVQTLAFLPDGNTLTSVSRESMRVWRAASIADAAPSRSKKQ